MIGLSKHSFRNAPVGVDVCHLYIVILIGTNLYLNSIDIRSSPQLVILARAPTVSVCVITLTRHIVGMKYNNLNGMQNA